MKLKVQRFIAILLLVIPGLLACFGFLNMKDSIFDYIALHGDDQSIVQFDWGLFILGAVMFFVGVFFIAGWVLFRDRKRNYVAPRFKEKREKPQKPTKNSTINK